MRQVYATPAFLQTMAVEERKRLSGKVNLTVERVQAGFLSTIEAERMVLVPAILLEEEIL